jgi:chromosome partitioning protein
MTRVAVFNQKGGVGKTTTVLNLSAASRRCNGSPLLLDLDPQGHLTSIHENPPKDVSHSLFAFYQDAVPLRDIEMDWENIGQLIPSHQQLMKVDSIFGKGPAILNRLKFGLESMEKETPPRLTFIDCCPYVGVLSLNALFAADRVIIPVSSDFLSLQGAMQVAHTLRVLEPVLKRRLERRYVLTRYDRRRRMTFMVQEQAQKEFGEELCKTAISENVTIAESPFRKMDVFRHNATSTGARDYEALFSELKTSGFL